MSDFSKQIDGLSAKKRKLFELLLKEEKESILSSQKIPVESSSTDSTSNVSTPVVNAQSKGKESQVESLDQLPIIVPDREEWYEPFGLTDIQQAYWIGRNDTYELGKVGSHGYQEIDFFELDVLQFNKALQRLIDQHDMLRAIFLSDGRQQILQQVPPYHIEVLDLRGEDPEAAEKQLAAVRERMSHQVLPADRWPLFEIRASRLDEKRIRLHISLDLLIGDAWSFIILSQKLFQLYQNPETTLVPQDISFRDYVLAEERLRESALYQRSLEYWRNRLSDLPPAPQLPMVKNPSSLMQPRFVRRQSRLEPEIWSQLKVRASQRGLTSSGILLAAFAEVLSAWSTSPRFTINLPLFNRLPLHPQVNEIIGDFTSVTLLAVNNSISESFEIRARRIQKQLWEDLEHRYYSGVRVLRDLVREQGGVTNALMPIIFTSTISLNGSEEDAVSEKPMGEVVYSISQTPQVWLDNQVSERAGALVYNWDAVEELFPTGLLDDMFDTYCRLLDRLVVEEDIWQETVRQLLPSTQMKQRATINATQVPVPSVLLHTLFAAQVFLRPQQVAVVSSARTLSYEELSKCSNQVGRRLRQLGAHPNTLIAVVMEKGWEQVVAVLGILQSGAAYLPIDPSLPKERLWYLLENGEVSLVLTKSRWSQILEWPDRVQRFCIDSQELVGVDDQPLEPVQEPEDLAYVIYTSGSTGQPKGVAICHQSAVNTIVDINERFQVGPQDRVLALSSLSFDLSVYDIFGTLAAGGTIIIPEVAATPNPDHWVKLMAREGVTLWNSVPALMQILVEYISNQSDKLLLSLRLVVLSGDWIPMTLPEQIKSLAEGVQVISLGGATEASIWSILYPIETVDPTWKSIPYGKPLKNQSFHVLNEALEPCPVWVPGELYIGGVGLAKGYWQDQDKTRVSFLTHPRTGERLYRTGDLGRYLPDGNIEFLGREDFQVKLQGHRIELGEIESVLAQHPAVRSAVVAAVNNRRLVAYLVCGQDLASNKVAEGDILGGRAQDTKNEMFLENPSPVLFPEKLPYNQSQSTNLSAELKVYLKEKLPEYMVPSAFVLLDALPLTHNGKVNRKALPEPDEIAMQLEVAYVEPQNEVEQSIAAVWKEVLQIDKVGVHDNFFDLGGNSVHIVRIHKKLQEIFNKKIAVVKLFEYPTIHSLATLLSGDCH
ncbi:MAG: amino acid adenylation domain-containing protein [Scytonema sp. PMC 1069.18]|nr:amino acid adenylation domain-containing protein [Scytonema sp. PMC 1069.18]MEC4881442.1 amino acid adenylation domain-containing protein [Scytonema sp. PMC 1070.18]